MAKLPESFIDNLLSRVDLVEIIGSRVPLKKQGKDYSARCPFHDERSPSFTVSPSKQFYYCFGCGAKGTAISFLMNYDRLTFMDAVEDLAKRAGIEIPKDARQHADTDDGKDLYAALEASSQFFQKQLAASDKAKSYLSKRGVDAKSLAQFAIGYAPEGFNGLIDALGTDDRRKGLLEKTGMLSKSDNGRVYDKFRGRIMFPIFDRRGRVIAFGGRVLEKDDGPKYLNSPETPLFHKGRELYGLWQVKQAHSKIPRLIVVEGYMDVVSLFQHGIQEAVATLGTATTPDHAELLFRNSADVVFCFDGDKAGRAAAWKAVESIIPRMRDGRQAFFLFLPEGEDPDTIVKIRRRRRIRSARAECDDLVGLFLRRARQEHQSQHPRRQGAPGRKSETVSGKNPRRRVPRPDDRAPARADRRDAAGTGRRQSAECQGRIDIAQAQPDPRHHHPAAAEPETGRQPADAAWLRTAQPAGRVAAAGTAGADPEPSRNHLGLAAGSI